MPGSSPGGEGGADPADACPLCGGSIPPPPPPPRVALARRAPPADAVAASAPPRDEASALREALAQQRRGLADLHAELEAERAAAAGAACEATSMILRLQREKAEALMDARQYRRYAEERFAHDAAEAAALHDALHRRDAAVRALDARLRACQARLLHLGYPSPSPAAPLPCSEDDESYQPCCYHSDDDEGCHHPLQCPHHRPADVGTPRTHHLLNRLPASPAPDCVKPVVLFGSPRRDVSRSTFQIALADEFPLFADRGAPDEDPDRVYTVDAVQGVPVLAPEDRCYLGAPRGDGDGAWAEEEEAEMQKLKARLQALEADRESMRHAIMSMGDEKAQVLLLREIAQQLCRDAAPFPAVPLKLQARPQPVVVAQRKVVKRRPSFVRIFVVTVIKWVMSIFCWRRKSNRIRYPIGMCGSNVGLMLVLDRFPKQKQKKIPTRTLGTSIL